MTDAEQAGPVAAPVAAENPGMDEQAAELVLARLADARVMLATRPAAKIATIMAAAVLTAAGAWLRTVQPARWPAVAAACVIMAAIAWAIPALSALAGRSEPKWVQAARIHQTSLPGRVPVGTLALAARCTTELPGRSWLGAYLYVSRCTEGSAPHFTVCQTGGVFALNGRLLVVLGEHLATGPSQITAAVLGHESRHVTGWRMRVTYLGAVFALAGWVITGWAVPWPLLLPAAIGLQAALTAVSWLVEASCDLSSAKTTGAEAMLEALARLGQVSAAVRAARPAWQRYAGSTLTWAAGPPHPPLPVRRALIRKLAR
jgi:hypothetical protein